MEKVIWCAKKNSFELIDVSDNLRDAYLLKAEDSLKVMRSTDIIDWKLIAAYYAIYDSLYALMMKIGVKCEIHTCTLEFAKIFLVDYFTEDDLVLFDKAFCARNDAQYYVNKKIDDDDFRVIIKKAPLFVVKCKSLIITQKESERIRKQVAFLNENKYVAS